MIGNELVMPYLLRGKGRWGAGRARDMGPLVVFVRRAAARADPDGGLRLRAHHLGLPAARLIGLISFCAVANFCARRRARPLLAARPSLGVVAGLGPAASSSGSTRCCCRPCAR